MYKEIFKAANDTIKMDEKLKAEIVLAMENEQAKLYRKRSIPFKAVILVMILAVMLIGVVVSASNNNWSEGMSGLFAGRIRQYEWTKVSNVDFNSNNFLSAEEIESLGDDVDILVEHDGLSLRITHLFADYYSLYGIIELTAPDEFVFRTDHKADNGSSFEILPSVLFNIAINNKDSELYSSIRSESYECYVLRDGNDKDNKMTFAFCINLSSTYDNYVTDKDLLNNKTSLFEENMIHIIGISSNCECEECLSACTEINKLLVRNNFDLQLPDSIGSVGDEIHIDNEFKVKADAAFGPVQDLNNASEEDREVTVGGITVTPFSIRYSQSKRADDFYASPVIVFKDGQKLSLLVSEMNVSAESELALISAVFPKPVNLDEIEYVIIGDEKIMIER